MRRFSVPVFRSWNEASCHRFFSKTTWKERGHNVSKLEPDGVIVLKTFWIPAEENWRMVIAEDGDYVIVPADEWFDLYSEKLVLQGSPVVPETAGNSAVVKGKPEVVIQKDPETSPKAEKEGLEEGRHSGLHYDGKTSEDSSQPPTPVSTSDPNNSARNTPNWIPKTFDFTGINSVQVREGLLRLSNLIFVKAHDYPTLLETFVPLKKEYLRNQFGRDTIEEIIRAGLSTGLIETDNHYKIGVRSIGYRFGEQFRASPFRIINLTRAVREDKDLKELLGRNPHLRYLHTHLERMTVDERALARYRNDWDIFEPCQSIIARAFYFKQDDFSGRIHTNLTNLKKAARGLLRIEHSNESLWEIDMANSQPLFAGFAARAKGFNDEAFVSLCEQGRLYEALGASWGMTRNGAKKETLKFFYAKNGYRSMQKAIFETLFPSFSQFMRQAKSVKHNRFAELAQREERTMIVDAVVPEVIRRCPGAFLGTVHDSMLVQKRHVEIVRNVLTSQFLGKFGVVPTLHVKDTADYLGTQR